MGVDDFDRYYEATELACREWANGILNNGEDRSRTF